MKSACNFLGLHYRRSTAYFIKLLVLYNETMHFPIGKVLLAFKGKIFNLSYNLTITRNDLRENQNQNQNHSNLCWNLFFNKVAHLRPGTFLKKRLPTQVFSCKFCDIFKDNFFCKTSATSCFWRIVELKDFMGDN